jgi:Ser/Thr protein kinase RdoA (MazF antagonist)
MSEFVKGFIRGYREAQPFSTIALILIPLCLILSFMFSWPLISYAWHYWFG